MPKTVLITGANKSIGYETARRLGELGYRIWLGARDAQRGEAAAPPRGAAGAPPGRGPGRPGPAPPGGRSPPPTSGGPPGRRPTAA